VLDVDGNFAYDNAEEEEIRALLLKHMMFNGEPPSPTTLKMSYLLCK